MSSPVKFKNHVKVSERHGASEWLSERVLLLALMPLGLWVLSTIHTLAGADYGAVAAWFANTLNAVLAGLTLVVFCGFASLAWKVILEDYVPQAGARPSRHCARRRRRGCRRFPPTPAAGSGPGRWRPTP